MLPGQELEQTVWEMVEDRGGMPAAVHGVEKRVWHHLATEQQQQTDERGLKLSNEASCTERGKIEAQREEIGRVQGHSQWGVKQGPGSYFPVSSSFSWYHTLEAFMSWRKSNELGPFLYISNISKKKQVNFQIPVTFFSFWEKTERVKSAPPNRFCTNGLRIGTYYLWAHPLLYLTNSFLKKKSLFKRILELKYSWFTKSC